MGPARFHCATLLWLSSFENISAFQMVFDLTESGVSVLSGLTAGSDATDLVHLLPRFQKNQRFQNHSILTHFHKVQHLTTWKGKRIPRKDTATRNICKLLSSASLVCQRETGYPTWTTTHLRGVSLPPTMVRPRAELVRGISTWDTSPSRMGSRVIPKQLEHIDANYRITKFWKIQ